MGSSRVPSNTSPSPPGSSRPSPHRTDLSASLSPPASWHSGQDQPLTFSGSSPHGPAPLTCQSCLKCRVLGAVGGSSTPSPADYWGPRSGPRRADSNAGVNATVPRGDAAWGPEAQAGRQRERSPASWVSRSGSAGSRALARTPRWGGGEGGTPPVRCWDTGGVPGSQGELASCDRKATGQLPASPRTADLM